MYPSNILKRSFEIKLETSVIEREFPMMKTLGFAFVLVLPLLAFPVMPAAVDIQSPAAPGSEAPNLTSTPDGRPLLSWLEPVSPKGYALRFSIRDKQEWTAPRTITSGTDWFVSGADYPTVAFMPDGTMAANSLIATNLDLEAYNTNVFLSCDAGKTWSKPVQIHRDKKIRQHGFVSFVPSPDGRLGAVWLDGRQLSKSNEGDMALFYTTIGKDGSIRGETTLDSRVCECCQTSAVAVPDALLVVYRDRSPKEVRDISVVRFANGKWSLPATVSKDDWTIDACPVNGPAISASNKNVAVAWFTVVNNKSRVYVAFSTDGGKAFGKAIVIDDSDPQGRVDVLSLASGAAIVSWVGHENQRNDVRIRQIELNGTLGPTQVISGNTGVASGAFPRILRSGNDVFAAWTAAGERPSIHAAVISLQ
jgi:hypothetical protein